MYNQDGWGRGWGQGSGPPAPQFMGNNMMGPPMGMNGVDMAMGSSGTQQTSCLHSWLGVPLLFATVALSAVAYHALVHGFLLLCTAAHSVKRALNWKPQV